MRTSACILLVEFNRAEAGRIQAALCAGENPPPQVQSIEQPAIALARISGGGIDLVILNISVPGGNRPDPLSTFRKMRAEEAQTPVLILADREHEQHALQGVHLGSAGYVIRDGNSEAALLRAVRPALDGNRGRFLPPSAARASYPSGGKPAGANGRIIAFLGVKGGVGTTTIALNTAAALAARGTAVILQLAPGCGVLSRYFYHQPRGASQTTLFQRENAPVDAASAVKNLRKSAAVPQLRALLGPPTAIEAAAIRPGWARDLVGAAGSAADYVVLDLGCAVSEANLELIQCSDFCGLVVERDPIALGSAESLLPVLEQEGAYQKVTGMVVVNRSPREVPLELSELSRRLAAPIVAVIPPAVELCIGAYQARKPLVTMDPESLVASCLLELAQATDLSSKTSGAAN